MPVRNSKIQKAKAQRQPRFEVTKDFSYIVKMIDRACRKADKEKMKGMPILKPSGTPAKQNTIAQKYYNALNTKYGFDFEPVEGSTRCDSSNSS